MKDSPSTWQSEYTFLSTILFNRLGSAALLQQAFLEIAGLLEKVIGTVHGKNPVWGNKIHNVYVAKFSLLSVKLTREEEL